MKFARTQEHVATPEPMAAAIAATAPARPLRVKGEPGTDRAEQARQPVQAPGPPRLPPVELRDPNPFEGPAFLPRGRPS